MFDDLHDPHPPTPGLHTLASVSSRAQAIRRRRMMTLAGSGVAVLAVLIAVVVVPRLGDDPDRIVTVDTVDTAAPTSAPDTSPTVSPETSAPTDSTVPSTDPGQATECATVPRPPVYLLDGSLPGDSTATTNDNGTTSVRWGTAEATLITQVLGVQRDLDDPAGRGEPIARGDFTAWVLPADDSPLGGAVIEIVDSTDSCERQYWVPTGLSTDSVVAFAEQWIAMLALDRSISVQEAPDSLACTYVDTELMGCVDVPARSSLALVDGRLAPSSGVGVLQLLVAAGAEAEPLSALARRVQLAGNPALELVVDLVPPGESCGRVTGVGEPMNWSIGGTGEGSCATDPPAIDHAGSVVAVDGNGDAVLIGQLDAAPTVLIDGADPDDPLPVEGTSAFIDGVTLSADGTVAVVGFCCEPGAGSLTRIDTSSGDQTWIGYGHLPAMSTGGNLVSAAIGSVNVGDLDGSIAVTLLDDPDGWVLDLAVVPGEFGGTALALVVDPDGTRLWAGNVAGGDMISELPLSTSTDSDFSLAGYAGQPGDGVFLVLDESTDTLLRFDNETLELVGSDASPADEVSMWIVNDAVRYIDSQRRLFVNDVQVPGEYLWVR